MEHFAWYFFPFTNGARDGTLPTYARTTLVGQRSGPPSGNWGRPVALFGIRRRRACLGMPTDGGR